MGDRNYSWASNNEVNLLTEDYEDFAEPVEDENFLKKTGQLKYELQVQLDHYVEHAITQQDEIIYFMKEGTVHQPEIFEMCMKGYNIDTSDFTINTDNSIRFAEPNKNFWLTKFFVFKRLSIIIFINIYLLHVQQIKTHQASF